MAIAAGIFRQYDIRGIVGNDLTTEAAHAHRRRVRGVPSREHGDAAARSPSVATIGRAAPRCAMRSSTGSPTRASMSIDIGVVPTPLQLLGAAPSPGGRRHSDHRLAQSAGVQRLQALASARRRCTATRSSISTSSRSGRAPRPRAKGTMREEPVIDRYVDDVIAAHRTSSRARCASCTTAATAPARSSRRSCSRDSASQGRGLFCESDGTFPNHHPDPTVPENLEDLIAAVTGRRRRDRHRVRRRRRSHRRRRRKRSDRLGRPDPDPLRARRARAHRPRSADHLRREVLAGAARRRSRTPEASR